MIRSFVKNASEREMRYFLRCGKGDKINLGSH